MRLLTVEDFKELGIQLADMRLLIEKFSVSKDKVSYLKSLITTVRMKRKNPPQSNRKKPDNIAVTFAWLNYDKKQRKFIQVKVTSGGGCASKNYESKVFFWRLL